MATHTDKYLLNRGYAVTSRLNLQIDLWKRCLHFNSHPSIRLPGDKPCIADVATGTALWLVDVAQEIPSSQCDGFDIDLIQYPPAERLPSNVQVRARDMPGEVPEDMVGTYDLVHVRLILLAIQSELGRFILNL